MLELYERSPGKGFQDERDACTRNAPFRTRQPRLVPFNPQSDSFGSYFEERDTAAYGTANVRKFPCNGITYRDVKRCARTLESCGSARGWRDGAESGGAAGRRQSFEMH